MCNIWRINKDDPSLVDKELTLEEFGNFCHSNPQILWMNFSGGEPFLKKDIVSYLVLLSEIKSLLTVNITTNGSIPGVIVPVVEEALRKIRRDIRVVINVSFEGPEDVHDKIVGRTGAYKTATETLRNLKELGKFDRRFQAGICYTISKFNCGCFEDFYSKMDLPLSAFSLSSANSSPVYGTEGVDPEERLVRKDLAYILKIYPKKSLVNPMSLIGYRYLQIANLILDGRKRVPEVVGGKYNSYIDPYWNVYPSLFHCPEYSTQNLRTNGFVLKPIKGSKLKECPWTPCEAYPVALFKPWRFL